MPDDRPLPDIHRETTPAGGRYRLEEDGATAEITWRDASGGRMVADHTGVPDALRGRGAGLALLARMVEDARRDGLRIVPQCPFVAAMRRRHPDWADAFAD